MDYLIVDLGIPESDVRDAYIWPDQDIVAVRLWNRRRFDVTGLDIAGTLVLWGERLARREYRR